jgi:hypothetical protein
MHTNATCKILLNAFILNTCLNIVLLQIKCVCRNRPCEVGPCHHGMARPWVADGGMSSYMEGSCE